MAATFKPKFNSSSFAAKRRAEDEPSATSHFFTPVPVKVNSCTVTCKGEDKAYLSLGVGTTTPNFYGEVSVTPQLQLLSSLEDYNKIMKERKLPPYDSFEKALPVTFELNTFNKKTSKPSLTLHLTYGCMRSIQAYMNTLTEEALLEKVNEVLITAAPKAAVTLEARGDVASLSDLYELATAEIRTIVSASL